MKKEGTIYGMLCPLVKKIVYVGQTTAPLKTKLALAKMHVTGEYGVWIGELKSAGKIDELQIVPLQRNVPLDQLTEREAHWIKVCKKQASLLNKNHRPYEPNRSSNGWQVMMRWFLIDRAIRDGGYTLNTLMDMVMESLQLEQYSKRSAQSDLENMRHNKELKFFAPIEYSKVTKTYYYSDPNYSILRVIEERFYKPKSELKIA